MPSYILMNAAQADTVRGQTVAGAACAPVPIANTNPVSFVLPVEIKSDPAHQALWAILAPFSVVTVAKVDRSPNTTLQTQCTFDPTTWTVGKKISVPP